MGVYWYIYLLVYVFIGLIFIPKKLSAEKHYIYLQIRRNDFENGR